MARPLRRTGAGQPAPFFMPDAPRTRQPRSGHRNGPNRATGSQRAGFSCGFLERAAGIEPASLAWKAKVLPLHNAREPAPDGPKSGGVEGIRTLETLPSAPLAGVCLRPLGHHSAERYIRQGIGKQALFLLFDTSYCSDTGRGRAKAEDPEQAIEIRALQQHSVKRWRQIACPAVSVKTGLQAYLRH